jgi:hypothetical protein
VIRVYDDAGNVIETHERRGPVQKAMIQFFVAPCRPHPLF